MVTEGRPCHPVKYRPVPVLPLVARTVAIVVMLFSAPTYTVGAICVLHVSSNGILNAPALKA
jgi:hypothetical protein